VTLGAHIRLDAPLLHMEGDLDAWKKGDGRVETVGEKERV
jgi:hypothetical protein